LTGLSVESIDVSVHGCSFSGPVNLFGGIISVDKCLFSFIRINVSSSILIARINDDSVTKKISLQNNTFINNTVITQSQSVINPLVPYWDWGQTSVTISGNRFSCNMMADNRTVAPVLPSFDIDILNTWVIRSNTMDPCPYECAPGYELWYGGVAGCKMCDYGWVSPGHIAPCTPCPAGTKQVNPNNCTTCEPGTYSTANSSFCRMCYEGTPSKNRTECIPCPSSHYSSNGTCFQCTDNDPFHLGCPICNIFLSVESDCKQLSFIGIIICAVGGGVILLIIVATIVGRLVRKKKGYIPVIN